MEDSPNPPLIRLILWAWYRFRPAEGWLPVFLLLLAVSCLSAAVVAADWVPEVGIIGWTATLGLLLGIVLAKRPVRWATAWLLLVEYGLVFSGIYLAGLVPPLHKVVAGWPAVSEHIRLNLFLLADRAAGWFAAISAGNVSEETVVFAFGLGGLAWLLAAYAGWSAFRQRRPLAGLTLLGLALAVNSYYGDVPVWFVALFVALAALLAATLNYASLEHDWRGKGVDYSQEIRLDLLLTGGGIALVLLITAFIIPAAPGYLRRLSKAIFDRPAVHQMEDTLQRVFAGVQPPQGGPLDEGAGSAFGRGLLPRSYLLGNPPELMETEVMRAAVVFEEPIDRPESSLHWRGVSYDIYTGRGWAISSERQEPVAAGVAIPLAAEQEQAAVRQSVYWLLDERVTRYTIGMPTSFDHDVLLLWRGVEDLSRVQGTSLAYTVTSQLAAASAAELRTAVLSDVPEAVIARYTQLPNDMPEEVGQLAEEVAGTAATPYDQALALQTFLHQYPYSLEVELPPADADPVAYFLFELQRGYCDYYASAMVVMARSLGLPARLAAGFLAQPADESGMQTIYQANAHSWAEIYFAGYGWVEFEPTPPAGTDNAGITWAPFPTPSFLTPAPLLLPTPPPIPDATLYRPIPRAWLLVLALPLVALGWYLWQRWQEGRWLTADGVVLAYGRLQQQARRLGQATPDSQTPAEFEAALLDHLAGRPAQPGRLASRLAELYAAIRPDASRLVALFTARQYAKTKPTSQAALESWQRLRPRLWLLRILKKVARS